METAASDNAASAASSAAAAEHVAEAAQLEAIHAADEAERAAASAAHVEAVVETVAANVTEVATVHADAAVDAAVIQIAAEIEEENTWLANETAEIKRLIQLGTIPPEQLQKHLSMMESLQLILPKLHAMLEKQTTAPAESAAEDAPVEVPSPPARAPKNKRRAI